MEGEPERELGMQQYHRRHIFRNMDNLIAVTNYHELMRATLDCGLFTTTMFQIIENSTFNKSEQDALQEKHRRYFEKITKRGPKAYALLKDICRSINYTQALHILESAEEQCCGGSPYVSLRNNNQNRLSNNNNSHSYHHSSNNSSSSNSTDIVDTRIYNHYSNPNGPLLPYTDPVEVPNLNVLKSDRIHTDKVLGQYTMQSQYNRGVLLLVNVIDFLQPKKFRNGAEIDGRSLIHIFREIGFTIFSYKNLNKKEFFANLRSLTESEYVQRTECFVMVLMTHGERTDEKDIVEFSDGSVSEVKEILDHFQADKCPLLRGKPKVLILPFCRGDSPDAGKVPSQYRRVETDGKPYNDIPPIQNVPTLADLLVCYASTAGYETHRDPITGSWYIEKFCEVMANHAHDTSLEDIVKKTQEEVGKMRAPLGYLQTGEYNNIGFNKKLFFNPGFFVEPTNTAN